MSCKLISSSYLLYTDNGCFDLFLLIHVSSFITSTCINSWLKKTSLSFDQLFNQLSKDILLFILTRELLTETINWMIENDYIRLENDIYNKIFY